MTDTAGPGAQRKNGLARAWWWVRLFVVLAILVALVIKAQPVLLWQALVSAKYLWVLAAVPFAAAGAFLDATRLYLLMKPVGFRGGWASVLSTSLVVNSVSLFLPGTVGGGAVAWYRLSVSDALRAQSFVALTLNAVVKFIVMCDVCAAALALDSGAAGEHKAWIVPLLLLAGAPLVAFAVMIWTNAASLLKRFHVLRLSGKLPVRIHDGLRKVLESAEAYRAAPGIALGALAVSAGRTLVTAGGTVFCLYAVEADLSYVRVLWIMCVVEAAAMMPFTLAGWGLGQVAYVGLVGVFGVTWSVALASHIVSWIPLMPALLAGAWILLWETLKARKAIRS